MPGHRNGGPAPVKRKTLLGVVGVATAAIVAPFVSGWESGGKTHLVAYHGTHDPAGVWTICDGETKGVKPGMVETVEGCAARNEAALIRHAEPVLACTPSLRGHPNQLSAAISLAYNIGTGAYCGSTVDRRFDAGQWRAACDAFVMWNKANGKVVTGLDRRRRAERDLCLKDLPR
ncbi:lysozyme [Sphingomonas aracearum]|uniref:Lysozyme n=1 Tax=Sphingomonas aracearum TaxID=2283317 RepID=A0A369VSP8_9SPHN|nr:lysozyme [Sphingomonas aracearum]RDE04695.1 lysozyme [Sphingomonas aracearum]